MGTVVVEQMWRYPVKSMGGERVDASWADTGGLLGDRVWAVQDGDGKLGSGKNTRRFRRMSGLLELSARYPTGPVAAHAAGPDSGPAAVPEAGRAAGPDAGIQPPMITGPDGTAYPVACGAAEQFLRGFTGLPQVRVRRDTGIMHFDEVPFSLVGTATLDWLAAQLPDVPIDARRFRPNLVLRTAEPFAEESWVGRLVRIGTGADAVHAVFDRVIERCVMVSMRQPGLPDAGSVLKRIAQREDNPLRLAIGGHITRPGVLRIGAPVLVSPNAG